MGFMNRFEEVSSIIEKTKQGDEYDREAAVSKDDPLGNILSNYQNKVDRQNSKIISDKNKFEVNTELREFEQA